MNPALVPEQFRQTDVRIAQSAEECAAIYAFRYPIYIQELGRQVSFADHERQQVKDLLDDGATHLYIERDGEIVAAMRWHMGVPSMLPSYLVEAYQLRTFERWPNESLSFTSRLMVRRDARVGGIVQSLAIALWELAIERGFLFNFMHTADRLAALFERVGCRRFGVPFEEPEIGLRQPLILPRFGRDSLAAIGSPLAEVATPESDPQGAVSWYERTF